MPPSEGTRSRLIDALGLGRSRRGAAAEDQARRLIAGYDGAAMVVGSDGVPVFTNELAGAYARRLSGERSAAFMNLLNRALKDGAVVSEDVPCPGDDGMLSLEVMVIPLDGGSSGLVLFQDRTLDNNLRAALAESRQRYKDLVEISSDFGWETGPDGTFVFVSPGGALGHAAASLVGARADEFVRNPEDYSPLPFACRQPVEGVEVWMRRADGSEACLQVSAMPLRAADGTHLGARGLCRDISPEREQEAVQARARHRELLTGYVIGAIRDEVEPHNMLLAAATATTRATGAAGCRIFRRTDAQAYMLGASFGDVEGVEDLESYLGSDEGTFETVSTMDVGGWNVLAAPTRHRRLVNGAIAVWRLAELGAWPEDDLMLLEEVASQLGIANEQINNHDRIVALSRSDELTGLLNRRAFVTEDLPRRLGRLRRAGRPAALFYVDLDNFKQVNDVFGHRRGDEVLFKLRDLLIEHSRPRDVIARLGGDEFAMWLDGVTIDVARQRAQALVTASQRLAVLSGRPDAPLGLSIGVAMFDPANDETLEELMARADSAMYTVKRRGKGGFELAPSAQGSRHVREVEA